MRMGYVLSLLMHIQKFVERIGEFFTRLKRNWLLGTVFKKGIIFFIVFLRQKTRRLTAPGLYVQRLQYLEKLIESHQGFFDVLHMPIGWNNLMFQRYQHISLQSAALPGGMALYGGNPRVDHDLFVCKEVANNLFVFDSGDDRVQRRVLDVLRKSSQPRMIRIQILDYRTSLEQINSFLDSGFKVVYEYIDLFSLEVMGYLPETVLARHKALLADERVYILTTSDELFKDVRQHRDKNFFLSTNGVDLEHWRVVHEPVPIDLQEITAGGRFIVGYHGTLAEWVDYDMLHDIADDGRFDLVLIGLEHDLSFRNSNLSSHPRVHFLGSRPYFELNRYAAGYDIAILPFKKNALTDTVSPVKIFEYMAAGKPIVTTNLIECNKYRSCIITQGREDLISKIELALQLRTDREYLSVLDSEADENSWQKKTLGILERVGIELDLEG
jgi:glycosyltransferase involved in cell wall biosynthesis